MALELEYKLQLPSTDCLEAILASAEVEAILEAPFRRIPMETTYYDNDEQSFSRLHWTLRHRSEGENSIVCLKTPGSLPRSRNEWQVAAPSLDKSAIHALILQGAPTELRDYYLSSHIKPTCGTRFLRRCAMVTFSDGSRAEIAADKGEVFGAKGRLPILELELELYHGDPGEMTRFAEYLCRAYGLREQPYSKFARASSLR